MQNTGSIKIIVTMDPEKVQDFLSEQREAAPEELQQSFLNIEDFWDRKLWHQLTETLIEYFNTPASAPQRLPLFQKFILSFAEKINQLKFVTLGPFSSHAMSRWVYILQNFQHIVSQGRSSS